MSAKVSNDVNARASWRANAEAKLLEGTEKEDMDRLLDPNSELSLEKRMAQNPRAYEKYQELLASAEATLDMTEIQANIMVYNLDTIERIEHLIIIEQQRFDAVNRELDRHRAAQKMRNGDQGVEEAKFKIVKPKTIMRKITNKKAA